MQPLISVIIPVYNSADLLTRCLNYLINQTYNKLEIIIIDDGSTDNTPGVCRDFAKRDARIKFLRQKNSGPANARNNGLGKATGEYVHFHDADDFVEQDYYEKMVAALNQSHADIICGEVEEIGYFFPKFDRVHICTTLEEKLSIPRTYMFNVVWRYLYRRDFLVQHNLQYPKNMFVGEDTMFMMYATYYANTIATAPGAVYHCISNPDSLGKNYKQIMNGRVNGAITDSNKYADFIKKTGITDITERLRRGVLDRSERLEFFHIPIFAKKFYTNGTIKYCFLNLPIVTKKQGHNRIKYYLCGVYVFRKFITIA